MTVEQAKDMVRFQTEMAISSGEKIEQLEKENAELQQKYLTESYEKSKIVKENITLKSQIEKMKSDLKNLDTSGTKGFVLERFWDLLEKWGVEE